MSGLCPKGTLGPGQNSWNWGHYPLSEALHKKRRVLPLHMGGAVRARPHRVGTRCGLRVRSPSASPLPSSTVPSSFLLKGDPEFLTQIGRAHV